MTGLDALAGEVGVHGRTLRRAAARGTIRATYAGARRIAVPPREYDYVRKHWPLLGRLLAVLRTEPNVRLAVLYGSAARGEDRPGGDLDLIVRFRRESFRARAALAERLEETSGLRVQVVALPEAEASPLLLADVLRDGRVLADRDGDWPRLRRRGAEIRRRAALDAAALERAAWEALERLAAAG